MKKLFLLSMFAALAIFISMGCMTSAVLHKKEHKESQYQENIESFLISQDGKKMVFISDKYHYILNTDQQLALLLAHKDEDGVSFLIDKGSYSVSDNRATARFSATIDPLKNPALAELFGYAKWKTKSNAKDMWLSFNLYGERYLASKTINDAITPLSRPINITINESQRTTTVGGVTSKIVLTPLALAGDVIMIGGVIVLVPLVIVGAGINSAMH